MNFSLDELKGKTAGRDLPNSSNTSTALSNLRQGLVSRNNQTLPDYEKRIRQSAAHIIPIAAEQLKKSLAEIVFIFDVSGSMRGLEAATINGFNDLIKKERAKGLPTTVTVILFNDRPMVVCDRVDINAVPVIKYCAVGGTALYDTIVTKLTSISNKQRSESSVDPAKTICVIMTDGEDESSYCYGLSDARKTIQNCRDLGWKIIFLGANIDHMQVARNLGIDPALAESFNNDINGVIANFKAVTVALDGFRETGNINGDWVKVIETARGQSSIEASDSGKTKRLGGRKNG